MVTGATPNTHWRPPTPQHVDMDTEEETVFPNRNRMIDYSQTSDVTKQYKNNINAAITLLNRVPNTNTNHKRLHTQLPMLRRNRKSVQLFWTFAPQPPQTIQQPTYGRSAISIFPELVAQRGDRLFLVTNIVHGDDFNRCVGWIQRGVHQRRHERGRKMQMVSSEVWSSSGDLIRISEKSESHKQTRFPGSGGKIHPTFHVW